MRERTARYSYPENRVPDCIATRHLSSPNMRPTGEPRPATFLNGPTARTIPCQRTWANQASPSPCPLFSFAEASKSRPGGEGKYTGGQAGFTKVPPCRGRQWHIRLRRTGAAFLALSQPPDCPNYSMSVLVGRAGLVYPQEQAVDPIGPHVVSDQQADSTLARYRRQVYSGRGHHQSVLLHI